MENVASLRQSQQYRESVWRSGASRLAPGERHKITTGDLIMAKRPTLTTDSGLPVSDNQNSITAGPRGPVLMQDFVLFEKLAHQNRERIPKRGQHAKGSGAYRNRPPLRSPAAALK
jgi:hypothetical protein